MKLNVQLKNEIVTTNLSLEELGLVKILEGYNNVGLFDLKDEYALIEEYTIVEVLKSLKNTKIIDFTVNAENIITVSNVEEVQKQEVKIDERILKTFKLTDIQYQTIMENEDSDEKIIYTLFQKYPKELSKKRFQINDENEYKSYIKSVTPLEVLQVNNKMLTINDISKTYYYLKNFNFDIDVFSFVYDYAITTSIYRNINYEYINKIFMSLANNKITSFEDAYLFIIETKEKVEEQYVKYTEPNYDDVQISNDSITENLHLDEELDIEDLFESKEDEELEDLFGDIDFE